MIELAQALYLLLAALGLALSVSYAGLPVLGQGAFVAVGGVGTALLGPGGAGLPLGVAVVLAVALAGVLGHLVALGAARLEGAYLALATWALAWLVFRALEAFPSVSGGEQGLVRPAPATLVSPALGLSVALTPAVHVALAGLLCLAVLVGLRRLDRGPAGLDLAALREGPALAASLGVPVAARRRAVLTATAALGGLSGAGTLVLLGLVAPADVSPLLSLQLFVAVLLGGTARWWGPLLGVAVLSALPPVADALAAGAAFAPERVRGALTAALLVAVLALRGPVARLLRRRPPARPDPASPPDHPREPDPRAAHPRGDLRPLAVDTPSDTTRRRRSPHGDGGTDGLDGSDGLGGSEASGGSDGWRPVLLRAEGVSVSYGAVQALAGAGLVLRGGQVHALVGPNGSGKSTLLGVLAGDVVPATGTVEVAGVVQRTGGGSQARVRAGVARTPQRTVVLPGSTPARQVAVGVRGGSRAPGAVVRHLLATPSSRQAGRAREGRVAAALAATGLGGVADRTPEELTVGEQRLLQVARVVATGARVLLLDEPAAGMTADERRRLGRVLRELAGNGDAVLLVEHDMRLVGAVADRVTVLDGGRVLASGAPERVRADPVVRAAYLGTAADPGAVRR